MIVCFQTKIAINTALPVLGKDNYNAEQKHTWNLIQNLEI